MPSNLFLTGKLFFTCFRDIQGFCMSCQGMEILVAGRYGFVSALLFIIKCLFLVVSPCLSCCHFV